MKYVYDITLNLKSKYLDFFEWNKLDKLAHFRKLPIIKIDNHDLLNFVSSSIVINIDLLNNIKVGNKYICVFISETNTIALEFDSKGRSILKSSLIVDEELDILENYYKLPCININYKILKTDNNFSFLTRLEQDRITFLKKQISKLKLPNDEYKIKYLYFECFGELEDNPIEALKQIKKTFNDHKNLSNLYQFFKLIQAK